MKKEYKSPSMEVIQIQYSQILCGSGGGIHGDKPQPPGGAMSPSLFFDDEEY